MSRCDRCHRCHWGWSRWWRSHWCCYDGSWELLLHWLLLYFSCWLTGSHRWGGSRRGSGLRGSRGKLCTHSIHPGPLKIDSLHNSLLIGGSGLRTLCSVLPSSPAPLLGLLVKSLLLLNPHLDKERRVGVLLETGLSCGRELGEKVQIGRGHRCLPLCLYVGWHRVPSEHLVLFSIRHCLELHLPMLQYVCRAQGGHVRILVTESTRQVLYTRVKGRDSTAVLRCLCIDIVEYVVCKGKELAKLVERSTLLCVCFVMQH